MARGHVPTSATRQSLLHQPRRDPIFGHQSLLRVQRFEVPPRWYAYSSQVLPDNT